MTIQTNHLREIPIGIFQVVTTKRFTLIISSSTGKSIFKYRFLPVDERNVQEDTGLNDSMDLNFLWSNEGISAKYDFGKQDFNQKVFFLEGAKVHMYNKKIKCH